MSRVNQVRGRALTYGQDAVLLQTRCQLLIAEGYVTDKAESLQDAKRLLNSGNAYDIVVLCHSVSIPDADEINVEVELHKQSVPVYRLGGAMLPSAFLTEVARLTGKKQN